MVVASPGIMDKKSTDITVSQTVKKFSKQLFAFIKGKVNQLEDAEDILQDVWYQFSKMTNYEEVDSISGWLYTVTRNKITDLYRKRKSDFLEDLQYEDDEGGLSFKEILLLDDSSNPELALFKEMFWDELFKALDELSENQKMVFVMNEIEDKTLQEIATDSGENIKTIISRKGYAVKHLRKKLLPLYEEFIS